MSAAAEPLLLDVQGLWCGSCARAVERALSREPSVRHARVSFATGTAVVETGADGADIGRLTEIVDRLGYRASAHAPGRRARDPHPGQLRDLQVRVAIAALFSMWTMVASLTLYLSGPGEIPAETRRLLATASGLFATPVLFGAGSSVLLAAWRTLRVGVPGMDFLIATGALSAYALSMTQLARGLDEVWFDTSCALLLLLLLGRIVELGVRRRGVDAVEGLLALAPNLARVATPERGLETRAVASVREGDELEVRPGETFPADGVVRAGRSSVDRAPLTGESLPLAVAPGDPVHAGCLNGEGVLRVRVTQPLGERRIDQVAARVRRTLDQRCELHAIAQRFAERLVPFVLLLAGAVLAGVGLATGDLAAATLRAVTVLVVTCPCALGMATPVALLVAVGEAARRGIVFRDPDALERAAQVDTVVFDKTGTLTRGRPSVAGVHPAPGVAKETLLALAGEAEAGSGHPLGEAVWRAAGRPDGRSGERRELPGAGLVWERRRQPRFRIGSRRWLEGSGVVVPPAPSPPGSQLSELWVAEGDRHLGCITLEDEPRSDAAATLAQLEGEGFDLALLSGDTAGAVDAVAMRLGGPAVRRAGCRPEDKAAWIARRQEAGARVAFVGDGINDAPGLAEAFVGIAVEGATPVATESASIVLQVSDLRRVADAIGLARAARRTMAQNLIWAVSYNALALPLAVSGWIRPEFAAIAMAASSLSVVLNALRLRGATPGFSGGRSTSTSHRSLAAPSGESRPCSVRARSSTPAEASSAARASS